MLDCLSEIHRRVAEVAERAQRFSFSLRCLSVLCDSAVKENFIADPLYFISPLPGEPEIVG